MKHFCFLANTSVDQARRIKVRAKTNQSPDIGMDL